MNGYYVFIFAFAALGLYTIVYSVVQMLRLDRAGTDYKARRKQYLRSIFGGVMMICVGVFIYFTKVVWRTVY